MLKISTKNFDDCSSDFCDEGASENEEMPAAKQRLPESTAKFEKTVKPQKNKDQSHRAKGFTSSTEGISDGKGKYYILLSIVSD